MCNSKYSSVSNFSTFSTDLSFVGEICLTGKEEAAISQPEVIKEFLVPLSSHSIDKVYENREFIHDLVIKNDSNKLLMIIGPGFITDSRQLEEFNNWFKNHNLNDCFNHFKICLNVNLNKIIDSTPFYLLNGLVNSRQLLVDNILNFPIIGSIKDELSYLYFNDIYSLSLLDLNDSINFEDIASGLSSAIGINVKLKEFNNIKNILQKIKSPNTHLSLTNGGHVGIIHTSGNEDCFIVVDIETVEQIHELIELFNNLNEDVNFKILVNISNGSEACLDICSKILNSKILFMRLIGFILNTGDNYKTEDQLSKHVHDDEDIAGLSLKEKISYRKIELEISTAGIPETKSKRIGIRKKFLDSLKGSYYKISNFTTSNYSLKWNKVAEPSAQYSLDKSIDLIQKLNSML